MPRLFIVILAAGLSQRLGFPKQLIRQQGVSLVRKAVQQAQALSPAAVLAVTPALDTAWAGQIHAELVSLPVTIVGNYLPQNGMAYSLKLAIHTLKKIPLHPDDRVLILTIDQVALTVADLHALNQTVDNHALVLSRYGEPAILGVPVNLPWGFLHAYGSQLEGDKGLRALWQNEGALTCSHCGLDFCLTAVDMPHLAMDLDTPAQFAALQPRYDLALPTVLF